MLELAEPGRLHVDPIRAWIEVRGFVVAEIVSTHRSADVCGLIRDSDFHGWDHGSRGIRDPTGNRSESGLSQKGAARK
jgi:hypothetical protein